MHNNESTASNNLFLVAKKAQEQEAEKQKSRYREGVLNKFKTQIDAAVEFVSADTLEATLLERATRGGEQCILFSIPATSFGDSKTLSDEKSIIEAHLRKIQDFYSRAEKNNTRQLAWVNLTDFNHNTGSLLLVIDFRPKQEITATPAHEATPAHQPAKRSKSSICAWM